MALVGDTYLTLKDKYAMTENGKVTSTIIDLLSMTTPLIEDAVVVECNNKTSNKTTVRNGLPTSEFRQFYGGVHCAKGSYTQVTDSTGMLETYSEVDKDLADLNNDKAQFRLNESQGFLESLTQRAEQELFYGNKKTNPAGFDGLANRYNKLSTDGKSIGNWVVSAGGTGNSLTSLWFVTWGNLHTHMIYPEGSQAGIQHEDKGQQTKVLSDGTMYEVYRDHYKWDLGLSVRDYRSTCRVANIASAALASNSGTLLDAMITAYCKVNRYNKTGKTVIYCNNEVYTALCKQAANKTNVQLTIDNYAGKPIVNFYGIPIKVCDSILNTESAIS